MKISVLGSGSEGNATFIEIGGVSLLVDAGFSGKELVARFAKVGVTPSCLKGILVTHEHVDHIKGVGILSRKYNLPIYITRESYGISKTYLGKIASDNLVFVDGDFLINGSIKVIPFDVQHDAIRTVGYRLEGGSDEVVVVTTDIGCITESVLPYFKGANVIVIESNYDMEMLQTCDYPYMLKQRIGSAFGHLCNEDSGRLITKSFHSNLKKVFLAHVSKNSNTYDLALSSMQNELMMREITLDVEVAYQHEPTPFFVL